MTRALATALVALGAVLALVALAEEARAATVDVTIPGNSFAPPDIEIRMGDSVRWINNHNIPHTATASGFDTGDVPPNGGSRTIAFQSTGTFNYRCKYHNNMQGNVRVVAAAAENTPPSVLIVSPPSGATLTQTATISGTANDPEGAPIAVGLRVDAGNWQAVSGTTSWTWSWNTRDLSNGPHTITARVSDGAQTTLGTPLSVIVANPPTITFTGPADNSTFPAGDRILIAGNAWSAKGTTLTIEVSIDGGEWRRASGGTSWNYAWNTSSETTGLHTIQARASDGAEIVVTSIRELQIIEPPPPVPDEPPILTIVAPLEGANITGIVNITGSASDPDGPAPTVEVNVGGGGWRAVSGRAGSAWWYHWLPEGTPPGSVLVDARASDGNSTVALSRTFQLVEASDGLDIEIDLAPRAGRGWSLIVRPAADPDAPGIAGARVFISDAAGATVAERVTNATGAATLPPMPEGEYTLRAYAPGAATLAPLVVQPRYDVSVSPARMDFDRLEPIRVRVAAEAPVRGVPVQLFGPALLGNESPRVQTSSDGNATFYPEPIVSGDLRVFIEGNDTGQVVRIAPILIVSWTPAAPQLGDEVRVRVTLNDRARTPAAGASIVIHTGEGAKIDTVADAAGTFVVTPRRSGPIRIDISEPNVRAESVAITIRGPTPEAQLLDLGAVPGPGVLRVSVRVRNAGEGPGAFVLDAVASSSTGGAVDETIRTRVLEPGEEEPIFLLLRAGPGTYDVSVSVRNSTASVLGTATVVDSGVPPTPARPTSEEQAAPAQPTEADTPGVGALGAIVALGAAWRIARRRR